MPASEAFDSIARGLAGGMSRRQALLKGGAAFLGAVTLTPADAWARATGSCPHHRVKCGSTCCPTGQVCKTVKKNGKKVKTCGCPAHTTKCSGHCVNTKTDPRNCGHCGHHCSHSQICSHGHCTCAPGKTACSGTCVSLKSDPHNCGACGHACGSGKFCSNGVCVANCPTGTVNCNGGCVSKSSDPNNCGACGHVCASGTVCSVGACVTSCPSGTTNCNGACVSTSSDNANCGTCGTVCAAASQLVCQSGSCKTCPSATPYCNGECVNFQTDTQNCGACGTPCASGQYCNNGACSNCPPSTPIGCGGVCYAGTACCGQGPQTVHNNGVGGNYFDCGSLGSPGHASTYTQTMAQEAAGSFSNQSAAVVGCQVSGTTYHAISVSDSNNNYALWTYQGPFAGHVKVNNGGPICPSASDPTWN